MSDQATEQSVEDRMAAFLSAEEGSPDEPVEEESTDEPKTEEVEAEAEEPESTDEPELPSKLKLTHNGQEVEVDLDEAKNLAQQGYDYTQKTQKLAEERKVVEAQTQAVKAQEESLKQQAEMQQALIKEIAKVTAIDEQIAQYEKLDWSALSDNDPVQAQKLFIQYQQMQNTRNRAIGELQQKHQGIQQQRSQAEAARLEKARIELLEAFPSWNAEIATAIRETGKQYGFTDDELSGLTDPRTVKILHDAMQFRKLQSTKEVTQKKVVGKPPVVKPGAKDQKVAQRTVDADLRSKLRKSGDQHLAAKLIERML